MTLTIGSRRALLSPRKGGGVQPPTGFAWLTDFENNAVFDFEGNRLYGAIV